METGYHPHPFESGPVVWLPPFYYLTWEQRLVGVIEAIAFMTVWAGIMWMMWPWIGPWIKRIKLTRDVIGDVHLTFDWSKNDKPPNAPPGA